MDRAQFFAPIAAVCPGRDVPVCQYGRGEK
jgi:hypothetical protein